jgi:hypothetical protein
MNNWTPIVVIVAIAIFATGIAAVVKNYSKNSLLPQYSILPQASTGESNINKTAVVDVTLTPTVTVAKKGEDVEFSITASVNETRVAAVETVFDYDPDIVQIVSVNAGQLFTQPQILANVIDTQKHQLSFAVGTLMPALGGGEIARIKATIKNSTSQTVPIKFNRTATKIALLGQNKSVRFSQSQTLVNFVETPLTLLP